MFIESFKQIQKAHCPLQKTWSSVLPIFATVQKWYKSFIAVLLICLVQEADLILVSWNSLPFFEKLDKQVLFMQY